MGGYDIADPTALVNRVYRLMSKELGVDPDAPLKEVEVPEEEEEEAEEEDAEERRAPTTARRKRSCKSAVGRICNAIFNSCYFLQICESQIDRDTRIHCDT